MKRITKHIGILILVGWVIISFLASSEDSNAPKDNSLLAYNLAIECVKQQLKSPSTAEFAGTFEKQDHVTKTGPDKYQILSYVDAQNSFGAVTRSKWSCTITLINGGDKYRCENVLIY